MNARNVILLLLTLGALASRAQSSAKAAAPTLAVAVTGTASQADDKAREMRRHWATYRGDGSVLHEVTTITTLSEEISSTLMLVRAPKEQAWRFEDLYSYPRKTVSYQITHLATGEFVRLEFKIPLEAKTRSAALLEAHRQKDDPKSVRNSEVAEVSISTRLLSRTASEQEWKDLDKSTDWRSDLRTTLTTTFLDGVEQMRDTLFRQDPVFSSFGTLANMLAYASYTKHCEPVARTIGVGELWPSCAFDKDFGMPCSKEQVERITRAEKKGVIPPVY